MIAPPTTRKGVRAGWTIALTAVAFFMVALDGLVVVTALPAIHAELGGSISTLEWAVNAYLLTFAAGIVPAAAIGDRLGDAGSTLPAWRCSSARRPPAPSLRPPPH